MENVNFNAQAQEIYKLLDDAETAKGVDNGSDRLGKSIWNSFVGEGQSEDAQIGTEKSRINNSISMENAVNSIVAYLRKNGAEKVQKALQNVGINWSPNDVYAEEVSEAESTNNSKPASNVQQIEQEIKVKHDELKKKKDVINKLAHTVGSEKGGKTYDDAINGIKSLKIMLHLLHGFDTLKLNDEELLKFIDDTLAVYKKSPGTVQKGNIEDLEAAREKLISCMESIKELEEKYPELKSYDFSEQFQSENSTGTVYDSKGNKIGTTHKTRKPDGTVEEVYKDNDGKVTKKVVEYLDGSSITTHYDKEDKETYKKIDKKEENGITTTFAKNGQIKLIVKTENRKTVITDQNGNPIKDKFTLNVLLDEIGVSETERMLCLLYFNDSKVK